MPHPPAQGLALSGCFVSLPGRMAGQWAPCAEPAEPLLALAAPRRTLDERSLFPKVCCLVAGRAGSPLSMAEQPLPAMPCLLQRTARAAPPPWEGTKAAAASVVASPPRRAGPGGLGVGAAESPGRSGGSGVAAAVAAAKAAAAQASARRRFRSAVWCVVAAKRLCLAEEVHKVHNVSRSFSQQGLPIDSSQTDEVDAASMELIELDLCRTFNDDALITEERRGWIRSMLRRHAASDPGLGYCQGMTLVAGVFAAASGDESEAYARFKSFMSRLRSLWLPGFPLLQAAVEQFEGASQARRWFKHLQTHGVDTTMYLPQALLTLFGSWLPLETLLSCINILESSCMTGMVAMAVAVMDLASARLLSKRSMDELLFELQALKGRPPEPQALVDSLHRAMPRVKATAAGARPKRRRRAATAALEEASSDRTLLEWVRWVFTTDLLQSW